MSDIKLAVFDCDGTLSDGQAGVVSAMQRAFAEVGAPPPSPHHIRRIVGLSLPQAVRQLMTEAREVDRQLVVEAYKREFRASREEGRLREPLFEGIPELLRELHAGGWTLGVCTGKSDRGLNATLAANDLTELFSTLHTADRHPSKPHPAMLRAAIEDALADPAETVMIGDTVYDIEMAKTAGVRAIGVAWGYHRAEELLAAGAEGVAETTLELQEMLDAR